jgi:hypothetical protein
MVDLYAYFTWTRSKVDDVHSQLLMLSYRNQADASHSSADKRSHSEYSDSDYRTDKLLLPAVLERDTLGQVEQQELTSFGNNDCLIGDICKLKESRQAKLRSFSASLEDCILNRSTIFNDKRDKKNYKETLGALERILLAGETGNSNTHDTLVIPGPLAEEVPYAQPYLLVVLQTLGAAVNEVDDANQKSPAKTKIQTNRVVSKTESRPKRVADKSIAVNSRFIFMLRDDSVEIPVEEKAGQRRGKKPEQLCHEGTDQVLSRLAKQVGIAFNFAGIGVDARATGVVLTAAYVKIVQLRLENMGTKSVKLIQLETKCMPLLSEASFDKWVNGCEAKWKTFKEKLYSGNVPANGAVPSGLVALWNLMTSSHSVLVGPSPFASGALGQMIGFGAFATVHRSKDNDNHIIKLSRYGATAALDLEAKVLEALKRRTEKVGGIASTIECKKLSVTIGGVDVQLPALILAPLGIRVEAHLAQSDDKTKALLKIGADLAAALDFVHKCGYNHNDVTPKNILFDQSKERVFLIDFGLASSHSDKIKGFRGTPHYAHRAVLLKHLSETWTPEKAHDKSSLAFSMAVLSKHGKDLWKSFQPLNAELNEDLKAWAEERSSVAWGSLKEVGFSRDWETWCFDK